jgi:ribonuclease HI
MKLAERNRFKLVWVAGHTGFDGNEIADHLARQGSSHPLTGPKPALGISAQVARGYQGLDKSEKEGVLVVHLWTKEGRGLS